MNDELERFIRGPWTASAQASTEASAASADGDAGSDRPVGAGSLGGRLGGPERFRPNPECSCFVCCQERILKAYERLGCLEPAPPPAWDADLDSETEAVRELDAEIALLQGMDAASRARYLEWDGNV